MKVAAGCGHPCVPERGLHQVDRCAALERVGRVTVAESVWRDLALDFGAYCGFRDDPFDHARILKSGYALLRALEEQAVIPC